jgi:hypothetical protein
MLLLSLMLGAMAAAETATRPALTVQAPDSPVRLDHAAVLTPPAGPPVLVYEGINQTTDAIDTFTVMAFVFQSDGTLKARQTAPARRNLDPRGTKYSTLVLDGSDLAPTDIVVVGVNQVQRVNSEAWWRADVQPAAEAAVPRKKP